MREGAPQTKQLKKMTRKRKNTPFLTPNQKGVSKSFSIFRYVPRGYGLNPFGYALPPAQTKIRDLFYVAPASCHMKSSEKMSGLSIVISCSAGVLSHEEFIKNEWALYSAVFHASSGSCQPGKFIKNEWALYSAIFHALSASCHMENS